MITLALDASTYRGTIAVLRGREVIASSEAAMRGAHAEALMPAVAAALVDAGVTIAEVERVICGEGPGSFTSLRIAASIAKGLCLGRGIPLFAVSSLGLTVAASSFGAGTFIATLDALRDEWYTAIFVRDAAGAIEQRGDVVRVGKADLDAFAASKDATVVGTAVGGPEPHARGCVAFLDQVERRGPVDLERWEPSYGRLAEAQVKWEAAHGRALNA